MVDMKTLTDAQLDALVAERRDGELNAWAEAYYEQQTRRIATEVGILRLSAVLNSSTGKLHSVDAALTLPTAPYGETKAIAAAWIAEHKAPKSIGLAPTTLSGFGYSYPYVRWSAKLWSDGVNGGVNETGLKRYRGLLRWAEAAGIPIEWKSPFANAVGSREEFEALIAS